MNQWDRYRSSLKPGMPIIGFDLQNQSQGCSSQVLRYIEHNAAEYAPACHRMLHDICESLQKQKQTEKSIQNNENRMTLGKYLNIL